MDHNDRYGSIADVDWLNGHVLWDNPSLFSQSFLPITILDLSDVFLIERAGSPTSLFYATGQDLVDLVAANMPTGYIEGDGIAKITVGTVEPATPSAGDLWIDTN
jgi:hypothetical protein